MLLDQPTLEILLDETGFLIMKTISFLMYSALADACMYSIAKESEKGKKGDYMNDQELKELRKRQEAELKRMGINNMEQLKKAMEEIELDISAMVEPLNVLRKETA